VQYLGALENNVQLNNEFQEMFDGLPVTDNIHFTDPLKFQMEYVRPGSIDGRVVSMHHILQW
jgi:hypothetical protein